MKLKQTFVGMAVIGFALALGACSKQQELKEMKNPPSVATHEVPAPADRPGITDCSFPQFSFAYSEYASWSTFAVAEMEGLVGKEKGRCGPIERKHGVDFDFQFMMYNPSIGLYAGGTVDAVTITNMDMLTAARRDATVVVFATSNSWGADRTIVTKGIASLDQLAGVPCRGLESTVSQYVYEETLRANGKDPAKYPYQNMEPDAASTAMIARDALVKCIAVWEPYALNTTKSRGDVHVLADSRLIPAQVLDLIVVGQSVLDRPKGGAFVAALLDTYYTIVRELEDPATSDAAHRRLGKKVTDLDAASMRDTLTRSVLYKKPEWVIELFAGGNPYPYPDGSRGMPLKTTMPKVVGWMLKKGAIKSEPTVGYGSKAQAPSASFRFDPTYVQAYIASGGSAH
ncbi:MAG: ABC transporter substrate-binding protein [Candidatus Uhrbacteria bacterium]